MSEILMFIAILIPVIGGALIMVLPFKNRKMKCFYIETIVVLNSLLVFCLLMNRPEGRFEIVNFVNNLSLSLRIDGLSMVFSGLVAALWPLATLYAFEYMTKEKHENVFFMFYIITYGITLGIAFSEDLLTMYFFY